MNLIKFNPPPDRVAAELDLVNKVKESVYEYAHILTVAQVIGCLEIATKEIWESQQ